MFLIKLLLILAVVLALSLGRVLLRLRTLQFRPPGARYSGLDEIPPAERQVLELPRAWLQAQGLRQVAWLQASELLRPAGATRLTRPEALYLSRDGRLRCHVGVSPVPQQGVPYLLRFVSTLADGTELITVNRAGALPTPPGVELVDAYVADDAAQLALHQARVGVRECRAFRDFDELLGHAGKVAADVFAWWEQHQLEPHGEAWRLTWPAAWRFLRLVRAHQARVQRTPPPTRAPGSGGLAPAAGGTAAPVPAVAPDRGSAAAAVPAAGGEVATATGAPGPGEAAATVAAGRGEGVRVEATPAAHADALVHAEAAMLAQQLDSESAQGGKSRTWVFVLTALGFVVLGKMFFGGGWTFMAALMVVLLVHELGHYAAMRAFGYRDLSIFFLPLLGAAAQGHKDNAPPWQQLVILLAGPLPGLLLALGGLGWFLAHLGAGGAALGTVPGPLLAFGVELMAIALLVNGMNLLPVQPLDGGRVAELLFFSRFPRASFGFFVAGVGVLGVAGFSLQDPVLGFLALVLGLSLPSQWRLATVARQLRPHFGRAADRDAALRVLAAALTQGPAQTWSPLVRLTITRALLPRLQGGLPGWPTLLLGGGLYLGLLASPLLLLLAQGPQALESPLQSLGRLALRGAEDSRQQEMEARLARAGTVEEKLRAHMMLYYSSKHPALGKATAADAAKAQAHLEAAWALLPPRDPLSVGRSAQAVLTAYVQDRAERDPAAGLALHAQILKTLEGTGRLVDQARWLQFKDQLLATQKAPLDVRIANREAELALWVKAAGPAFAENAAGGAGPAAVATAADVPGTAAGSAAVATGKAAASTAAASPAVAASSGAGSAAASPAQAVPPAAASPAASVAAGAPAGAPAPATAAAPAASPFPSLRPGAGFDEYEARSGLVLARRFLALLQRQAGHADTALALLQLNHAQALRMTGDPYRYLRDSTLADLSWALLEAGRGQEVAPLFAGYAPLPDPFADYEDDTWHYTLPEQVQAWAEMENGDTAAALARFERLAGEARRADPEGANVMLHVSLDLDLLLAQQRAGRSEDISRTQAHLAQVLKKAGDARWLAAALQTALDDPWNLSRRRVRAHADLLRTLGYAVTEAQVAAESPPAH